MNESRQNGKSIRTVLQTGLVLVLMVLASPAVSLYPASPGKVTLDYTHKVAGSIAKNANTVYKLTSSTGPADSPSPMFQHDAQHTGRSPYAGPATPHLRWSYLTSAWTFASPAIGTDGTLYVGSGGDGTVWTSGVGFYGFYAIDEDGTLQWGTDVRVTANSRTSPAIADDGTIYTTGYPSTGPDVQILKLFAFNPNGTLKWTYDTRTRESEATSPTIGETGIIYFVALDKLYAINPDGSLKWSYPGGGRSSPALGANETVYSWDSGGTLYAVDSSGSLLWTYATGTSIWGAPAVGPSGTIYVGDRDGHLYAINPDGTLKWRFTTGGPISFSAPAISSEETIYIGSQDGKLYAINSSGNPEWTYKTEDAVDNSSPSIDAAGTIYVGSADDRVYALNPDGTLKWSYQTGDDVYAPPVIGADGTVYVRSRDRRIYALWDGAESSIDSTIYVDIANTTGVEDGTEAHPFNRIKEGISFAPNGYTVKVAPGTYSEATWSRGIAIIDHDVALMGAGATLTTIDGGGYDYTLSIGRGVSDATMVKGFTITNNSPGTACVSMGYSASPLISNNIFVGCKSYAIVTGGNANLRIINNTIVNNSATGILLDYSYASPTIKNNIITNNTGYGIWRYSGSGSSQLSYNDVWQNVQGNYQGITAGVGSISADPLFVDPANGDYHLHYTSPAVDAGDPTSDFTHEPIPNGGRIDMGAFGNTGEAAPSPPTGSITIANGATYITNTAVVLSLSASEGVVQMAFSDDGNTFTEWESYATTKPWVLPEGDGTKTVYVKFRDFLDHVSSPIGDNIVLDSIPPTGEITIENDATFSPGTAVTLNLSALDVTSGVAQMRFSNDGTDYSAWESYTTSASWMLTAGDGPKIVYVQYKDNAGNVSDPTSDTIVLDTTAPTGSITVDGGAAYANSISVVLTLSADDALSGVSQMSFSNDGSSYGDWESYGTSKAWMLTSGDGTKTVYVSYKDNAGNVATYNDTIVLDTTSPSSTVASLPAYQTSTAFTVSWSGYDALAGLATYDVQYRDEAGGAWTDWLIATTTTSASFTGQDGHIYSFRARATDNAGNTSTYSSGDAQTTVDTTAPTPGSFIINGGALNTTSIHVTLDFSASDATSGVAEMSFSNDGIAWGSWQPYSAPANWSLSTGDGLKTVYGRFRDTAGNVSSVVSDTIELNTTVDPEYGLTINEGALFTNQTAVTLTISARPGTAQMKVSNDGGFAGAAWESYAIHKAWTITHYGSYVIPRVVYIRYKDVSGNVSATYQDDIILDVTPPTGSVSIVGPGGLSRLLATNSIVTLSLSATDDVSGVGGMLLSNTPDFGGASWEAYATIRIWDLGNNNTVYVRFRDNAGNISQTYSASLSTATSAQISPASGGTLDSGDGHVHLDFPAGAVTNTTTITYTGQPAPMHALGSFRFAGRSFTLEASASGQPVTHFTRPFTLTLTYADADWQATGITDEDQLNLYYWGGLQWIGLLPCASCSLDTVNNRLIVVLDHLTEFGFLACPLAADVDHNGVVDIRDIQQAVTGWHSTYTLSDIQGIAAAWGTGCGP